MRFILGKNFRRPRHHRLRNSERSFDVFCSVTNLAFHCGSFPVSEKRAIVTPVLKKSGLDKNVLSNYRPISCLSFLSKFVERAEAKRVINYLTCRPNSLFCPYQSAYRFGHSTESVLLHLINELSVAKTK